MAAKEEIVLKGIPAAPGIAIGPAYSYSRSKTETAGHQTTDVAGELKRFATALSRSERDLRKIIDVTKEKLGESSAAIFEAQILMLQDDSMADEVTRLIESGTVADHAVTTVMSKHRQRMEASTSDYLKERSNDLLDIQDRLIHHIQKRKFLSAIDSDSVVVAQNLSAADIILFSRRGIKGCCLDYGGPTSHVSIMARSLRVPSVVGLHDASELIDAGDTLIIDGLHGEVVVNPSKATQDRYEVLRSRYLEVVEQEKENAHLKATTIDGKHITLRANIELRSEIELLGPNGAEGVGLFRSEMLFLMEGRLSIEEETQFGVYQSLAEAIAPDVLTIRVLDLGGDKILPMAHREHNPFLGWRGIRVLLDKHDLLRPQLRAILRASPHGNVRIMVPMVTTVQEVRDFKAVLEEVKEELVAEELDYDSAITVGAMIEVPAAALLVDQIGAEVDFLSIGTNDLTQYVLAVDRGNDLVAALYDEMHPAVLRIISDLVASAKRMGKELSICGEMAGNSRNVPVLIGLGISELSASPTFLPELKRMIRAIDYKSSAELAQQCLDAGSAVEIENLVQQWLDEHPFDLDHILAG